MKEEKIIEDVELLLEQKPQEGLGMSTGNDSNNFLTELPEEDGGDDDSHHSHSGSSTYDNPDDSRSKASSNKIAHEESIKVARFRIILVVVLGLVGAGTCFGTYLFVRDESDSDYKVLSVSDLIFFICLRV